MKISTNIYHLFPDHLSDSYDYGGRKFDEYFLFYSIVDQKFKMQKEIFIEKAISAW